MHLFGQMRNTLNKVANNLDEMMIQAMIESKEEIVDLNVSQIEKGIASDGSYIGDYESPEYADLKQSLGSKAPAGIVDLKLTGDFLESVQVSDYMGSSYESSGLFVDFTDEKSDNLQRKYPNIIGISPENHKEVQELIGETFFKNLNDAITNIS